MKPQIRVLCEVTFLKLSMCFNTTICRKVSAHVHTDISLSVLRLQDCQVCSVQRLILKSQKLWSDQMQ